MSLFVIVCYCLTKFACLQPRVVVWLRLPLLAAPAPEGEAAGDVGGGDPLVPVSPEPAVDVDGLEVLGVTALVLEVTFPARGVDGADVVCMRSVEAEDFQHSLTHLCASS